MPALTPLPPAPSILDPENFSEEADAFVAALPTLVSELNAIIGLTIPAGSAAASTLTGATLAANVLASSLTSLGTIASLVATAISGGVVATQANQETGTSVATVVTPGRQHFHPSAAKAWGLVGHPTTITAAYPATGVSNTNTGTGIYTVTHGLTMSSANYVILIIPTSAIVKCWAITSTAATNFAVLFNDVSGTAIATSFGYVIFGDM